MQSNEYLETQNFSIDGSILLLAVSALAGESFKNKKVYRNVEENPKEFIEQLALKNCSQEEFLSVFRHALADITGLPPYRNTKKSTKPLLHGASQKKLIRSYWVHFSLENGCTVDCIWSRAIP